MYFDAVGGGALLLLGAIVGIVAIASVGRTNSVNFPPIYQSDCEAIATEKLAEKFDLLKIKRVNFDKAVPSRRGYKRVALVAYFSFEGKNEIWLVEIGSGTGICYEPMDVLEDVGQIEFSFGRLEYLTQPNSGARLSEQPFMNQLALAILSIRNMFRTK